jgi:LacI family transcriptional regulator
MKSVNIKELANELQLSVSTVSKALHDSYEISDKTKQRVLEAAQRLNYVPHAYASSLRGRKTKTIGIVIPEVADSFFSLAINGIESIAKEKGYHVLICLTHENFENEKAILKEFQGGRVDGVLMSVSKETANSEHISDLIGTGVPLIFFDRVCDDIVTGKITTDDDESGYKATTHLIDQGCSAIYFLSISDSLSISNLRLEGYRRAMRDRHMHIQESQVVRCTNDHQQNYLLLKELLSRPDRPDGLIASVEKLTTPIYQSCNDLGLTIPGDVKVICFSNLDTASILNPSLTTITQPAFEIGRKAAQALFQSLEKGNIDPVKNSLIIPSELVQRESTSAS